MTWFSEFDIRQIDDTYFKLLIDLVYFSKKYQVKITVPSGTISDGPSVGRWPILFWLFGKKGKRAAVIHDWLYRNGLFPRGICDDIFLEALVESGYTTIAKCMYLGVRIGGARHYAPKGKEGCLDPRTKCTTDTTKCSECCHSFPAYKLTVTKVRPEDFIL